MASSSGSSYTCSLETTNFARICRIVVDVLRDILWQVLTQEILPTDLPKKVQTDKKKLGKLDLKIKTWLCGLSPSSNEIPSAERFDVSSLYTLIRNLCSQVPTPSTQWGQIPPAGGITLGDDIERVREFRNTLYGHATLAKIETPDFNKLCIDIKNVVSRFDAYFCSKALKCDFEREIDTILTCCMDKSLEDDYIDKMKEIAFLSDDLGDIKHQVGDVKLHVGEVKHQVGDVKVQVGEVKDQVGDVKVQVGEVKHQVGDVKVQVGNVDQHVGDIKKNLEIVLKGLKENAEDSRNRLCKIQETLEKFDMEKEKDKVEGMNNSLIDEEQASQLENENAGISRKSSQSVKEKKTVKRKKEGRALEKDKVEGVSDSLIDEEEARQLEKEDEPSQSTQEKKMEERKKEDRALGGFYSGKLVGKSVE